jgi:hypothetical protein
MHHANRMWTPEFNRGFEKRYGFNPMKYYPALWYDIGPNTAAVAMHSSNTAPRSSPKTSSSA